MFVNISNHPTTKWGVKQLNASKEHGRVEDLKFPNVPPEWGQEEVQNLADQLVSQIQELSEKPAQTTVHVMGEMTLVHSLVTKLKERGYRCVASSTKRMVVENPDGTKTSRFEFVKFRQY